MNSNNVSNYLSLHTTVSGRIQDGAKLSQVYSKRAKITLDKNNPVYSTYEKNIIYGKWRIIPNHSYMTSIKVRDGVGIIYVYGMN